VCSQKRNAARPVVQAGPSVRIGIGSHTLGSKRKTRGELQRFVRRQTRHLEKSF
jgi:hypothetical protein